MADSRFLFFATHSSGEGYFRTLRSQGHSTVGVPKHHEGFIAILLRAREEFADNRFQCDDDVYSYEGQWCIEEELTIVSLLTCTSSSCLNLCAWRHSRNSTLPSFPHHPLNPLVPNDHHSDQYYETLEWYTGHFWFVWKASSKEGKRHSHFNVRTATVRVNTPYDVCVMQNWQHAKQVEPLKVCWYTTVEACVKASSTDTLPNVALQYHCSPAIFTLWHSTYHNHLTTRASCSGSQTG